MQHPRHLPCFNSNAVSYNSNLTLSRRQHKKDNGICYVFVGFVCICSRTRQETYTFFFKWKPVTLKKLLNSIPIFPLVSRSTKNPDFHKLSPVGTFIPIGKRSKTMHAGKASENSCLFYKAAKIKMSLTILTSLKTLSHAQTIGPI